MPVALIKLLECKIEVSCKLTHQEWVSRQFVELMSVDGQVPLACRLPRVFLMYRHAHKVRHDIRKPVIMVSFNPDHLDAAPRIRQLSNVGEKVPVFFGQPSEVEVAEDVTEEDQPVKAQRTQ